ncbi:MAG: aldo/keto reductase [Lachnospiraceae bacterium]|nr:aldo/keto reductase [Lachnospiraceae bacterium]
MEKRTWNNCGVETSLLGFGCMRFPTLENGQIDEKRTERMLDEAMAAGVNYYDTAYPYHGGESERVVGRLMKKYDRSSFYLATKLPVWLVKTKEDVTRYFEEQLSKLQTDYIDFYLLHALGKDRWADVKKIGILDVLEEYQRQGRIKHLGFSFHDGYEVFEEILRYRKWDFCQIQYNYMDTEEQAGDRGYALTEELGVPLVIMEPVKGGSLAKLPEEVEKTYRALKPDASTASFALRWVGSHPNVKVVLSGMSSEEQVRDNLHTFTEFEPLSEEEQACIKEAVKTLRSRVQNGCTGCRYCMPCPFGVNIPGTFRFWNTYHMYQNYWAVNWGWENMKAEEKPEACKKCGKCEQACPQKIAIREDLARAQADLDDPQWKP